MRMQDIDTRSFSMKEDAARSGGSNGGTGRNRVCIVTPDIVGPVRNGGIGTAYTSLALTLAAAGIKVDILYALGSMTETDPIDHWVSFYEQNGIRLIPLPELAGEEIHVGPSRSIPYRIMRWLIAAEGKYNIVHFPDWRGLAYYTVLAKHQGFGLADTEICVGAHSPTAWGLEGGRRLLSSIDEMEEDFMERESVRLCDVLISPSRYMIDWMVLRGWQLPERRIVQANLVPSSIGRGFDSDHRKPVTEIVFFGRLERRKGLDLFLRALSKSSVTRNKSITVTFLGKGCMIDGKSSQEIIEQRTERWSCEVKIISDRASREAIEYLKRPGRLAVMPSLSDNSPYVVLECLAASIPFLTSNVGGIPELVAAADHGKVLFDLFPGRILELVEDAVENGAVTPRGTWNDGDVERDWIGWHRRPMKHGSSRAPDVAAPTPKVSVCLVHFNRPNYLEQAVSSLRRQDYPNLELVLIDCSSDLPEAVAAVKGLQEEFDTRGWKIVKVEDRYLGAARNDGAQVASGDFLLFMDDDNFAKADMVSQFVRVANRTGADVLTCMNTIWATSSAPMGAERVFWLPLGFDSAAGVFRNVFGDANALVRKSTFQALGGFTEVFGVGHEDWEFFAKAKLAGYTCQVIPFALYWYRHSPASMTSLVSKSETYERVVRPYVLAWDADASRVANFALGHWLAADDEKERLQRELMTISEDKHWLVSENEKQKLWIAHLEDRLGNANDVALLPALSSPKGATVPSVFTYRRPPPPAGLMRLFGVHGKKIKRVIREIKASDLFDADWYVRNNGTHCKSKSAAAKHYVLYGAWLGLDPSAKFSSARYLIENVDVAEAGANPLLHYIEHGKKEGRPIHPASAKLG